MQQQLKLLIHGYVAAKHTSLDSWRGCSQREDFAWTKVTGGIQCCPELVQERKRVNDTDDGLTVLAVWLSRGDLSSDSATRIEREVFMDAGFRNCFDMD